MAGSGFEVTASALRTTAGQIEATAGQVAPMGTTVFSAAEAAAGATPSYLTGTACLAFAGQFQGVLALLGELLTGHASGLVKNAKNYEDNEDSTEQGFRDAQSNLGGA